MKEITVILTGYKRDYFKKQIESIKRQEGVEIKEIILWQNGNFVDLSYLRDYGVKIIKSDINFKFHGRFTLPLLLNSEYTAIFDDDIIPGHGWLKNAIRCVDDHNCISGANGRWYKGNGDWRGISDNGICSNDTKVDFVGHSWVFKTEIVRNLWRDEIYTFENGEDIQFCLLSKIYNNIDSYVPRQSNTHESSCVSSFASDEHASYLLLPNHTPLRVELFKYLESKGYKRLL